MTTPGRQAPAATTARPCPQNAPGAGHELAGRWFGLEIIMVAALIALIGTGAAVASSSDPSNHTGTSITQTSLWSGAEKPVVAGSVPQGSEAP